jgi:hypothetical protein
MNDITIVRTMNNQMIIGFSTDAGDNGVGINKPFSVIPLKEGIKLYPLDLELIGNPIENLVLQKANVLYQTDPSEVLKKEYVRIIKGEPKSEDPSQSDISETLTEEVAEKK